MDSDQIIKRRGRPSKRDDGDGQVSADAVGTGIEIAALEKSVVEKAPVLSWESMSAIVEHAEKTNSHLRIVRVWHPKGPDIWQGVYGNAMVEPGNAAYQFSSGEIVKLP